MSVRSYKAALRGDNKQRDILHLIDVSLKFWQMLKQNFKQIININEEFFFSRMSSIQTISYHTAVTTKFR